MKLPFKRSSTMRLHFLDISRIIHETMSAYTPTPLLSIEDALETDRWSREKATALVKNSSK